MIKLRTILGTQWVSGKTTSVAIPESGDEERDYRHDAAVAHALMRAIGNALPESDDLFASIMDDAAEILRTNFGIE